MTRSLEGSVVVVTGASRGIGRATAKLFAERGASVVLAARQEGALVEAAAECEALGGRALAVPMDVADHEAVEELARRAEERFGGIDVWVNGAVLLAFGRLEDVPAAANRRVVETNLLGYMHGAQAALRRFRERDSGILINISSGFALVGSPYAGAYTATKFAQRGLGQALRGEVRGTGVRVCTIMPGGVDTPAYRLAANYARQAVRPTGPLATPERIARVVVRCAERPRPEVIVGPSVRMLRLAHWLSPALAERAVARGIEAGAFEDGPTAPDPGNLYEPKAEWSGTDGGFNREAAHRARTSARRLATGAIAGASVLGSGLAAWLLLRRARG
jgi:NAD(P)-dependent dehydrogenase (short-subunit alcohol dehydrogenase family)